MSVLSRLYRGENDFDFPKWWKLMLSVSGALVLVSVLSLATRGLNLSIDFKGGAVWEVPSENLTTADAEAVLSKFGKLDGAKVQSITDSKGRRIVRIQAGKAKNIAESQKIADALAAKSSEGGKKVSVEDIGTNTVGPSWGTEITRDAIKALAVFLVVIALYISWQLAWRMALSALAAVVHDVVVTVGVYSIFGFQVTPATVISFLTILGYSLYDTIVVYDRVQENTARYDRTGRYTYRAIMRRSLNQVLMRSLNTTFVAILPVVSILVIGGVFYGQTVMFDFALALLVGLIAGAYSSLAVASPMVVWLKEREPKYAKVRNRARDRGAAAEAEADWIPIMAATPNFAGATLATSMAGGPTSEAGVGPKASPLASKAAQYQRDHPPRPRKQGKKR